MKKLIISVVAVLVIAGGGILGWKIFKNGGLVSAVPEPKSTATQSGSQEQPPATQPAPVKEPSNKPILPFLISLESIVKKHNTATIDRNLNVIWDGMHPDDKLRWQNKDEYVTVYNRTNFEVYDSIKIKTIIDLPTWTHPISGKVYSNVKQVVLSYVLHGATEPTDVPSYYQKYNDNWYFFSQRLSANDRLMIKNAAQPGTPYKELSKTTDRFVGQKAWYRGKVIQIQEDKGGSGFLLLGVTQDQYGYWNDNIYVSYTESTSALQDDIVTVYGILTGAVSYTSGAGYLITVPGLEAVVIEK